jgi:hypothetical protein
LGFKPRATTRTVEQALSPAAWLGSATGNGCPTKRFSLTTSVASICREIVGRPCRCHSSLTSLKVERSDYCTQGNCTYEAPSEREMARSSIAANPFQAPDGDLVRRTSNKRS